MRVRAALPRLAVNLFSMGSSAVVSRMLTFVTMIYVARKLGQEAFGLLNFGIASATYAAALVGPGLLIWGTRAISKDRQRAGDYLVIINLIQLGLALVAYPLLFLATSLLFGAAEKRITLAAGLSVFAVAASVEWVAQGLERFVLIGVAQIVASLTTLLVTVALVRSPVDVYRVPLIAAGAQIAGIGVLFAALHYYKALSLTRIEWSQIASILRSAWPLGSAAILVMIVRYANHLALYYYWGRAALGIFVAAFRLFETLTGVPVLISSVFLPRLSRTYALDPERAKAEMHWYIRFLITLGCLPAAVFAVDAQAVIRLLYTQQYAPAVPVLRILSVATVFNFAAVAYITGLLVMGRDRVYLGSILAAMFVAVGGSLLLVPRLGIRGATLTVAVLDFSTWLVTLPTYRRLMGTLFLEEWLCPVGAGIFLAAWLFVTGRGGLPFVLRLPLGMLGYAALVIPWRKLYGRPGWGIMVSGH